MTQNLHAVRNVFRRLYGFCIALPKPALVATVVICLFVPGFITLQVQGIGYTRDIWSHTYRISAITNGDIVARQVDSFALIHNVVGETYGGAVDADVIELSLTHDTGIDVGIADASTLKLNDDGTIDVPFNGTSVYSPASYAPQLAGWILGRALGLDAATCYYMAELTMLLVWTILGTIGIFCMPRYKLGYFLLYMMPIFWYQFSFAISADSMSVTLALLFGSILYRNLTAKPSGKSIFGLSIVTFCLCLSKFAYFPLALLALTVPIFHRDCPFKYALIGFLVAGIALNLGWLHIGTGYYVTSPAIIDMTDVTTKKSNLVQMVVQFLPAMAYSIIHTQALFSLGSEAVAIFWSTMVLTLALLITVAIYSKKNNREGEADNPAAISVKKYLPLWIWIVVWLILLANACAVYLALWLEYTPIGQPGVNGIQHRYFVPFVPFLYLLWIDCVRRVHTVWKVRKSAVSPTDMRGGQAHQ